MKTAKYKTLSFSACVCGASKETVVEVIICQKCRGSYYRFLWKLYPVYCAHCGAKFEGEESE